VRRIPIFIQVEIQGFRASSMAGSSVPPVKLILKRLFSFPLTGFNTLQFYLAGPGWYALTRTDMATAQHLSQYYLLKCL
jgi:hypothetical protein